ncbi:MAG TPA: MDR family MFS transporter [Bacillota bacterium]
MLKRRFSERGLAVMGVMLCLFLAALDQTIVSTALPRITEELGGLEQYAWVATSYLLASVLALPVYGRLVELAAGKWVLFAAASVFLLGSALAGLAPSMTALIAFRGLQGIGGGGLFATAITTVGLLYPPRERGRVQGAFAAVFSLSSVIGPWVGGLLTDHLSWRWVFYVNMPVGAVALYFLLRHMPALSPERRSSFDLAGTLSLTLWTVPLILACSWGGVDYPWTSSRILGLLALSAAGLVLFVALERRSPHPLCDLTLFRLATFRWATLALLFFGGTFLGGVMFLPLYLVQVKGFSAANSGLSLTPLSLGVVTGSLLAGQLAVRVGRYKPLLLMSTVAMVLIFAILHAVLAVETPLWQVIVLMVLLGVAMGPSMPLFTLAVQNSVARERMGTATSATQFSRQIGSTIAVALLGTVLVGTVEAELARQLPPTLHPEQLQVALPIGEAGPGQLAGGVAATLPAPLRAQVEQAIDAAITEALRRIYAFSAAMALLGLCCLLPLPDEELRRRHVTAADTPATESGNRRLTTT